jgi:acylphosphatase
VEAMIYGQSNKVNEFIEWCRTGPERANVDEVIISYLPEIKYDKFEVIG